LQIDTGIRCLLFQQPTAAFSEPDKYKIDQYVMQGGKVLWMVDRLRANNDSMRSDNFVAVDNNLNLDDLLFKYGVRLNDNLALDLRSTRIPVVMGESGGQPQQQLISWPFYPLLLPTADHPVVRNLDNIEVKFAGNIDTVKAPGIRKTVLLATSPYTKLLYSPVRVSLGIVSERIDPKQYNKGRQPIAVLLEGTFPSLYRNRLAPQTQAVMDSLHMPAPRGESKPTAMIVVADGDLGANAIGRQSGRVFPMGFNPFERQTYANKEFLLNAIDYLADESGLIAVRNKDLKLRLLDKTKTHNQRTQWQLVTIGLPLALLGLLAMGLQTWRKRRFAR
jgi:gliding-associated putative ABC transporter substrate-binding component GldG